MAYNTEEARERAAEAKRTASTLPRPAGYKILIALAELEEKTEGAVFLPDQYRQKEQAASVLGFVVECGPDAYKRKDKFPTGPWCKDGDWVLLNPYAGVRITIFGKEFRLVNDDVVEATIENPMGIGRAGMAQTKGSPIKKPTVLESTALTGGMLNG